MLMKKNFTAIVALSLLLLGFIEPAFSQLSEGGTPPGFKTTTNAQLHVISLPAINVDSLLTEDAINEQHKETPYRFGYNHLVNYNTSNSGAWSTLENGDRLWQLDVKTAGSYSINLAFSNWSIPAGAKLFVYSKDHQQVLGGFTNANNTPDKFFGTELINGDEAIVEYYEPATAAGQGNFTLFRITQGYKDLHNYLKSFGQAGSCIHNINCPQYSAFGTVKRSVVCLVSGGNEFCSGALVNNTLNDGTPYILTANHCGTADGTWVFRFNWEAPGCSNPSVEPSILQSITGAIPIAHSSVSDFNLVKMDTTPPASFHVFYAGWNHSTTPATSVTAIHHPSGDIKKCSQANNPVTDTSYDAGNGVAQVWQIGQWTDGVTEPGSSGSPLLDQNKRIVGQLYGGPSACGEVAANLRDYYGRFCVSWDSGATPQTRLKDWLDPNGIGTLSNDGFDPPPPRDSLDIALTGVISPTDSSCTNNIAPAISVQNLGSSAITSFTVKYRVDGGAESTYLWTGTLLYLGTANVSLAAFTGTTGAHTIYFNLSAPNGATDQNHANDSALSNFVIYTPSGLNLPLSEGFEANNVPPASWSVSTPASGTTWTADNNGAYGLSSYSAHVDEFSPFNSTAGETPGLFSPAYSFLGTSTSSITLKFDVAYARYDGLHSDSLAVLVSTDCGASWSTIYQKGGVALATANDTMGLFVPTANQWRTDSVNISSLAGQPSVLFNFEVISGYGNAIYLDNINISDSSHSVGINTVDNNISVSVFPNPFTQNFNLKFALSTAQNIDAALYSIDGKKLITLLNNEKTDAGNHQMEINTGQISNGLYILKVNEAYFKIEKMK